MTEMVFRLELCTSGQKAKNVWLLFILLQLQKFRDLPKLCLDVMEPMSDAWESYLDVWESGFY